MNKLQRELHRLYGVTEPFSDSPAMRLSDAAATVRCMVLGVRRGSDWAAVSALLEGLVDTLELPMPAVSVSAEAGFQVWFSLAEAVPSTDATRFLRGLRKRFLADLPDAGLCLLPGDGELLALVPALHEASGRWSAYIDPGLVSMFGEEAGLDMPPSLERQGEMLAGLTSIRADDFARVLHCLDDQPVTAAEVESADAPRSTAVTGQNFADPGDFLLAVMNDPSIAIRERIRAARILLKARGRQAS